MKPWLLDRRSEAPLSEGYCLVENEVALLAALLQAINVNAANADAADETACHVRGESLCDWAQKACRARGWSCEERQSPLDDLLAIAPNLSREHAALVWHELHQSSTRWTQFSSVSDVLQDLYPDFAWHHEASFAHAASWLLWRDGATISAHHNALLEAQTAQWRFLHPLSAALYVSTTEETSTRLRQWLHLEDGAEALWGAFAQAVAPRWMQQINQAFAKSLTRDGAKTWMTWRQKQWPTDVLESSAQQLVGYLELHAGEVTPQLLASLQNFLSLADIDRLQALSPPRAPSPMPAKTDAILRWVTNEYLPFRRWQAEHGDDEAGKSVYQTAQGFARWYLGWYSGALMGFEENRLATHNAHEMRNSDESSVVLWVIADGLGWLDAQRLQSLVVQRNMRLSATRSAPVFAPVPTITHFCKRAVRWGIAPREALKDTGTTASVRRESAVSAHRESSTRLREAKPGDLVIWQPLEPDAIYHKIADRSLTHDNVEGALVSLANQIVTSILQVPDDRVAKIVITTDHGRLLGRSQRRHAAPSGYETHGRTAYRVDETISGETQFDEDGVSWQGDLAWLDAERFGLPTDCIIAIDDSSFLTNSTSGKGHSGTEEFPHGGVFPEEVVIPWIEIERDAATLELSALATGSARAESRGLVAVTVENTNAISLQAQSLVIVSNGIEYSIPCDEALIPFSTTTWEVALESWPTRTETKKLKAWLEVRRLDGRAFKVETPCDLEVEEMQSRDNDLLGGMT